MPTAELSPASKHLVDSAATLDPLDFHEELATYEGKYAAEIVQEALNAVSTKNVKRGNMGILRLRLKELKREGAR